MPRRSPTGRELTVAHGGWESEAHERYDRFFMPTVLRIPERILAQAEIPFDAAPPVLLVI